MKEKFAMVRSFDDGSFEFIPGIEGSDMIEDEEKIEEYNSFWDSEKTRDELSFPEMIRSIVLFFDPDSPLNI